MMRPYTFPELPEPPPMSAYPWKSREDYETYVKEWRDTVTMVQNRHHYVEVEAPFVEGMALVPFVILILALLALFVVIADQMIGN